MASDTLKICGYAVIVLLILSVISAIGAGLGIITLPWNTVTAQIDSGHEIIESTYDSENAIYNYEWFKTQYEKIQATENKIENTEGSLKNLKSTYGENTSEWSRVTETEYNRQSYVLLGLKNHYNDLVAEYNARSKMANRNIFKDGLPMNVDEMLW